MQRTALEICAYCYFVCNFSWIVCVMTETVNSAYSYTAVGVFVLGRLFREAWGRKAPQMQAEFNDFLEVFHSCSVYFILCAFCFWCFSYFWFCALFALLEKPYKHFNGTCHGRIRRPWAKTQGWLWYAFFLLTKANSAQSTLRLSSLVHSDYLIVYSSYNRNIILTFSCSTMKSLAAFVPVHDGSFWKAYYISFILAFVQPWLQLWQSWVMVSQNSILLQRWLHFVGNGDYQQTMSGYFLQGAHLITFFFLTCPSDNFIHGKFPFKSVWLPFFWHDMLVHCSFNGTMREEWMTLWEEWMTLLNLLFL